MADAPSTSAYVLVTPDGTDLPASRTIQGDTPNGIQTQDTGASGTYTITSAGNLRTLATFTTTGILCYNNTTKAIFGRGIVPSDATIAVTNFRGDTGNMGISVIPSTSVQQIQVASNGTVASTGSILNFIPGEGAGITVQPGGDGNSTNVTISAVGGGSAFVGVTANGSGGGNASTLNFLNGTGITFTASAPVSGVVTVSATVSGGGGGGIPTSIFTSGGQVLSSTASNTPAITAAGTSGQVLTSTGAGVPIWTSVGSGTIGVDVNTTPIAGGPFSTLNLIAGTNVTMSGVSSGGGMVAVTINATGGGGGGGTVTSVGITNSGGFTTNGLTVSGSPVTTSGNITVDMPFPVKNPGSGSGNIIMGSGAGNNTLTGGNNIILGSGPGSGLTSGASNIIMGLNSGQSITNSNYTISLGQANLGALISSDGFIALGTNVMQSITAGADTIAIGTSSGTQSGNTIVSLNNCLFLGSAAQAVSVAGVTSLINSGAIGAGATIAASNAINIGNGVNVGLNQQIPLESLHVSIGANTGKAAILMDNSTSTPSAHTGSGSIYVQSSSGTQADQLWFQPGTGSAVQLVGVVTGTVTIGFSGIWGIVYYANATYMISNGFCTINVPGIIQTGNNTTAPILGGPVVGLLIPANDFFAPIMIRNDFSGTQFDGIGSISIKGGAGPHLITISATNINYGFTSNFTGSVGSVGFYPFTITYPLF